MSITRTRKNKENPHYNFLYSWTPPEAHVKGESALSEKAMATTHGQPKRANLLAKDGETPRIKKDILRSILLVSFILILEVVVYLALHRV